MKLIRVISGHYTYYLPKREDDNSYYYHINMIELKQLAYFSIDNRTGEFDKVRWNLKDLVEILTIVEG
jgi:hypothetical protein